MSFNRKVKYLFKKILSIIDNIPVLEKRLPKYPFGKRILGNKDQYIELHKKGILNVNNQILDFQNSSGFSVNNEWFTNLTLYTQTCIKNSDLNFNHGRLLYSSLSKYINDNFKNKKESLTIFETGTARGFSSICMSRALIDQHHPGMIISIDCIAHEEEIFWNSISDLDGPKTRANLLSLWKEEISNIFFIQGWTTSIINRLGINRIHFAFLDAQHTKNDVLKEFKFVYKKQIKGDLIVFDDVTLGQFEGVCKALDIIESQYPYKVNRFSSDSKRGYAIAERK